jgi:hypothetical protein
LIGPNKKSAIDRRGLLEIDVPVRIGPLLLIPAVGDALRFALECVEFDRQPLRLLLDYRLAFRELGLSIGLRAVERLPALIEENPGLFDGRSALRSRIERLVQKAPLSEAIEGFWLKRANRETGSWMAHREINMVMLATSLAPDGYLGL